MHTRVRLVLAAAGTALLAGLFAPVLSTTVAGAAATTGTDAPGDTVNDDGGSPLDAPRADILAISADARPDGIALGVRLSQLVDPLSDPNWSSDASYLSWELDMGADRTPDFEIELSLDPGTHSLAAFLYRSGLGPRPADGCDPRAGFDAQAGYTVVVDPKCLGGASTFAYRAHAFYDTDVKSDDAQVATDASPDEGWTARIAITAVPGAAPLAPQAAPPPATPQSPSPAAGARGPSASVRPTGPARPAPAAAPRPAPRPGTQADPGSVPPDSALANTGPLRPLQLAGIALALIVAGLTLTLGLKTDFAAKCQKKLG
jgi:hypothetical protein